MPGFETRAVHVGQEPDPVTGAVVPPLTLATTFAQDEVGVPRGGYDYARAGTPTRTFLEGAIASLENAAHGYAFGSGLAAIDTVLRLLGATDHVLIPHDAYGGTFRLIDRVHRPHGLRYTPVDLQRPEAIAEAWRPETRLVWIETPTNPTLSVIDIATVAAYAHDRGALVVVDNTFATPYLQRPLDLGADVVVHSLTKYLGGHGTSLGGAIVDSGKFPWAQHKARFKRLNEPDVSYHGVVYTDALGPAAYIGRARVVPLRNMGAAISPFNAFLILQGVETLGLRMDRISDNTLKIAQHLKQHPRVKWVNYAGLEDHPENPLVKKYLSGKASGLLTFGVPGGREGGARFLDGLKLFTRLVNIGDVRSLATHPASTTHRQLSPEELAKTGVTEDTVRLSVGIEHIDDLLADLDSALAQA